MWNDINAVLFDMDGTLVDSMWVWHQIDVEFLEQRNIPFPKELNKDIEGMSFVQTADYFIEKFHLPNTSEQLQRIWNDMARDHYINDVVFKEGAWDLLHELKAKNKKIAMGTSNSRELVNVVREKYDLDRFFDAYVTSDEIVNGKPAPDVYLRAAKEINVNIKNCLVFEDMTNGIIAGKSAGAKTCAINDSFSAPIWEEKKKKADYFIDSYYDLPEVF
ncbi:HAD family hydrolase [Eubacterium oxidoreducens]|uniref:Haloacid dehalogenase superfamily, subfamily IA, variant 3 with third motif having DD or ED n=1 Tax=Eubacterium oxidoreducens TaxID=1732 RepID=A0A1G6AMC7_EUBOX|nr:HAD family phosphatase [Eubacterium oxidoreducens]SDB09500.1 haloacid dehalogenase superfamily, subfamily IA, variant 3 with third motif having DD or ED [Eubacterium oxidoreducens]